MMVLTAILLVMQGVSAGPSHGATVEKQDTVDTLTHELEKIDRAIEETKQIIRTSLDEPYLPDLYFHLAELYVERSRFEHARGLAEQSESGQALSSDRSLAVVISKKLAIETYEKIVQDFPDYENRAEVYFFEGHEFRELGEAEPMLRNYSRLLEKYPKTKWAVLARLILGDRHYDLGEYDEAEKYYKEILAPAEGTAHPMARYKMGWVRLQQSKWKEALEYLREAVITADKARNAAHVTTGASQGINVRHEALMAMAWPFVEFREAAEATAFFRPLAESHQAYIDVLKKLVLRYNFKNKLASAAIVEREILRLDNNSEETLAYVAPVVNAVNDLSLDSRDRYQSVQQDAEIMTTTLTRLVERPDPVKERADAPVINESVLARDYELHVRDIATRAHNFGQNAADKRLEQLSANAYAAYLKAFPKSINYNVLALDRANALFDALSYYEAAQEYERVALKDPSKGRQQDVYNAVLAYYRALDEDSKHRETDPDRLGTLDRLELLRAREGLKQLGSYYVSKWPKSDNVPTVRFNIARMYYQQGDLAHAADALALFVKDFPTHKDVATAGRLALDALYKLERLDDLAALATTFAKDSRITDSEFRTEAARLAESARRRKLEFTVIASSDEDFSKSMLGEFEKYKNSPQGEQYLYAGFAKSKQRGDFPNTFLFGEKIMAAYPNSKYGLEVVGTLANFAAQEADYERAAWMSEEYSKRYPKDAGAIEALARAAELRMLLGEPRQAEQDFTLLLQVGTAPQKTHAAAQILEIYAKSESWSQLAAAAGAFMRSNKNVAACFYAGLAAMKQGSVKDAQVNFAVALRLPASAEGDASLQARAAFELARGLHTSFSAVQFQGAQTAEKALSTKLELLGATEQSYLTTIRAGDSAWAVAATFELSRLYNDFATFVTTAPAPSGTNAAQYQAALSEQAKPYFEKGKQTRTACGQKAEQLKLLTVFGQACVTGRTTEVGESPPPPPRTAAAQDAKYQKELEDLRVSLRKNLKNAAALKALARAALAKGDFYYARLVLSGIGEINGGKTIDGWMGLTLWQLGEPQQALEYLEEGRSGGNAVAALNLSALYQSFGYEHLAQTVMPDKSDLKNIEEDSIELSPAALRLLKKVGDP